MKYTTTNIFTDRSKRICPLTDFFFQSHSNISDHQTVLISDKDYLNKEMQFSNGQSVIFYTAYSIVGHSELVPISSTLRAGSGVHPGQVTSPSQCNTQTTMHTFIHTPKGNLERPIKLTGMFLDCGRKPEYPERTHACTGRTCKLHAERLLAGSRTQDLLAARQQCYQLRHRFQSSLFSNFIGNFI
ncbi:hypothetical protein AMECASPLE_025811 [Ameca splendens]|uniref:Uncharacterized protein n=1 Tax=Ameca splendens TaxID=208324 RepID=A0ABV0ZPM1_9TELE